jgi:uncharacterized protein YyaL (SSP411 family)
MSSNKRNRRPNRLINATSPYLLQHAYNPVDWYPWGEEALARAKAEDKPILLSVGYAACHWCHVMEHESFEDEETAALMNQHFINVKVDREERPDIDAIYMTAVQAMTGSGGWPMTVFLTPDGVPFFAGTYFPPEDRWQMPSFRRVLRSVAEAYASRRNELLARGRELVERMREAISMHMPGGTLTPAVLDAAFIGLQQAFDPAFGGFGRAPKFPQPMTLEFLLRYAVRTGRGMEMLEMTLRRMAEGGMYDQLGGGFHRYSVDAQWLVPHFEKMLYDNALLARVYLETFQATGNAFYRRIAGETLDYMLREMHHPEGGFFSTQDADSLPTPDATHKHEGAFFVWTPAEIREALGTDAIVFSALYGVTDQGNFEGKNILHVRRSPAEVARVMGMPVEQVETIASRGRRILFEVRQRRPMPELDDKVLTAWNGMAIRAFALGAVALDREDYRIAAVRCARFVLTNLRRADGELLRSWRRGVANPTPAFLEDYALLADGLLALYEATFDPHWLLEARVLADSLLERFWDEGIGGFYDTGKNHEQLVIRPRDTGDNATPSGSSAAVDVLLRLALIFDEARYRERALRVLESMVPVMQRYPTGFGRYLAAAEFALGQPHEIALIGNPEDADTQALAAVVLKPFLPNRVIVLARPGEDPPRIPSPLLSGRGQIDGKATAYVCQNYACQLPVTEPSALEAQVRGRQSR